MKFANSRRASRAGSNQHGVDLPPLWRGQALHDQVERQHEEVLDRICDFEDLQFPRRAWVVTVLAEPCGRITATHVCRLCRLFVDHLSFVCVCVCVCVIRECHAVCKSALSIRKYCPYDRKCTFIQAQKKIRVYKASEQIFYGEDLRTYNGIHRGRNASFLLKNTVEAN